MSILQLPLSLDDLELAWLKESYAEGYGKTGKAIAAKNYVRNPSSRTNLSSIAALTPATTLSRDTVEKYSSVASVKVTNDGTATNQGVSYTSASFVKGKTYRGSFRIKGPVGTTINAILTHPKLGGGSIVSPEATHVLTGNWDIFSTDALSVVDTPTGVSGYIHIRSTNAVAVVFNVDTVVVSDGAEIPGFFDGATPSDNVWNYEWTGFTNNSTSIKWSKEPVLTENLYTANPSFEGPSLVGHNLLNVSASLSMEQFYEGTQSLKLVTTVDTPQPQEYISIGGLLPFGTYTFSAWSYSPSTNQGSGTRIRVGGTGQSGGDVLSLRTERDQWIRHVLTFNIIGDSSVLPGLVTSNKAGDVTYWDKVTLVRGTVAADFNGNSPDSAWFGAPNASFSVLYDRNAKDRAYLEKVYWAKLSGLSEPASLADHKLAALRAAVKTVAGDPLTVVDRNYVLDPTCENAALPGISASRASISRSNVKVKSGTYAIELVSDGSVGGKYLVMISSTRKVPVQGGDLITHKFSIAKDAAAGVVSIQSRIYFIDAAGNFFAPASGSLVPIGDAYADNTFQVVAPQTAVSVQVEMIFSSTTMPAGDKYYFDELYFGVNGLGNYFNPDTSFSRWQGVANNSISELVDGSKNSITDLWVSYLMSRSGLTPASKWSLADHEMAFYKSQLGL